MLNYLNKTASCEALNLTTPVGTGKKNFSRFFTALTIRVLAFEGIKLTLFPFVKLSEGFRCQQALKNVANGVLQVVGGWG